MNRLPIDYFTNSGEDTELTKYKILGILKEYLSNIRGYKLYPTLTELVNLSVRLENMMTRTIGQKELSDTPYSDSEEDISILGNLNSGEEYFDDSTELAKWTSSMLYPILDEGIAVYEFVDENMDMLLINGNSSTRDNGYLIIPDHNSSQFNIYSYHCILFKTDSAPIKSIKTLFVQSHPINNTDRITDQLQVLVDYIGDKNLPVYYCSTELDFPYEETIFQIARKKIIKVLSF